MLRHALTFVVLIGLATVLQAQNGKPATEISATTEEQILTPLRRAATNVQLHKDGTVRLVRLSKDVVNDQTLELLQPCKNIDYLAIVAPAVTDAGLESIRGLTRLDTLVLSGTALTDSGLAALADLKELERLYLDDTRISSDGLAHLSGLSKLKVLSLQRTEITDCGLTWLKSLVQLESLFLNGTAISDAGLEHLAAIAKLQTLHLNDTRVRGTALSQLANLAHLEDLNLSGTPLCHATVENLSTLTRLRRLSVFDSTLSQADLQELRNAAPEMKVYGISSARSSVPEKESSTADASLARSEGPYLLPAAQRYASADSGAIPDFQRHVLPLLGRLGCNGRSCHGSFQGQGGFRLSMFGYDFSADHQALCGGDEPRVNAADPAASLVLNKPMSEDAHGGGERFERGSWQHHLLQRWIAGGSPPRPEEPPQLEQLQITPAEIVWREQAGPVPLQVVAIWSDGLREDVTCLARYQSNDEAVAEVDKEGVVQSVGGGDTHVVIFYDNAVKTVPVIRPLSQLVGRRYPAVPTPTHIDQLVVDKLAKLGVVPSAVSSDAAFLRRVSLDMIGTLPTPEEIREFCSDASPRKRAAKIEQLLERPAYVTWWTQIFCDLTGSNAGYLGSTEMAQPVAQQWRDWIQRRIEKNVGYDRIAAGILLATSRRPGQSYEAYVRQQSGYTRRQDPDDFAALDNDMPHYWYRSNLTMPKDKALAFGYTFLGVRLQCAECHKHPYDQWSQEDFQMFTEFFTRIRAGIAPDAAETHLRMREMLGVPVKLNTAALRRQSYLRIAAEGRPIPWNEIYIEPPGDKPQPARLPGGPQLDLNRYADPREPLVAWLRDPNNYYFSRAIVNRIWAHYFGVGIVDPTDDLNLANPPSNQPLLDYLAMEFVAQGFDLKWLHREITSSRTYQLDWRSNETNRQDTRNFSHAQVRRLAAEVIIDAIHQATAADAFQQSVVTNVAGRKIGAHPKSYQARSVDYSLLVFGKSLRTTNCDCERQTAPTLLQALYVRNDRELLALLDRQDGWLKQLSTQWPNHDSSAGKHRNGLDSLIETAYLRTLSRWPDPEELADCRTHVETAENLEEGFRDLLWALINSQQFATNH